MMILNPSYGAENIETHLLTIQIKMKCFDDIDARGKAHAIINTLDIDRLKNEEYVIEITKKLQEIKENAPPRKIEL